MPIKLIRDLIREIDSSIRTWGTIFVYLMVLIALSEITGMTDVIKDVISGLKLILVVGFPFGLVALIAFLKRSSDNKRIY